MQLDKAKFGEMLRKERQKKHLTMQKVADQIGTTRETVRLYELGRLLPSKDKMQTILDFLNIDMPRVFGCSYDAIEYQIISRNEFRARAYDAQQYMQPGLLNTNYDLAVIEDFINSFERLMFERTA